MLSLTIRRGRLWLQVSLLLVFSGVIAVPAVGGVIRRVPGDYPTIQAAITAAQPGDTVLVADGTHRGDGNRDIELLGKAIIVRSEHGPLTCIIDCEASSAARHRGFRVRQSETAATVISGFTIQNGYAPPESSCYSSGGGILCYYSNPTIRDCIITQNRADPGG